MVQQIVQPKVTARSTTRVSSTTAARLSLHRCAAVSAPLRGTGQPSSARPGVWWYRSVTIAAYWECQSEARSNSPRPRTGRHSHACASTADEDVLREGEQPLNQRQPTIQLLRILEVSRAG